MKHTAFFSIILSTALIFSLDSCTQEKINFNPQEGKNTLIPPPEIAKANITMNGITFSGYQLTCNQPAVDFTVTNLSGDIGILTVNSFAGADDCNLTVRVSGLCTTCDANIHDKTLKPGGSMTDLFDISGHTGNLTITITCSGTNSTKCTFSIDFSTGQKLGTNSSTAGTALSKPIGSNPTGNAPFQPVQASGNQCTTKLSLLKVLYLEYDKKSTSLNISYAPKPLCDCIPFNVYVSTDEAGTKQIGPIAGNEKDKKGTDAPLKPKDIAAQSTFYFWGECAGGKNPPCRGDVIVTITGGAKK